MDAFTVHTGTAVPLRRTNVDTDQIIPAEYLKRVTRTGFQDGLFSAWRSNETDFVLNQAQYAGASILVAGPDFGTGSSREHAVWALMDYGFRVVISPRFGDIFRGNSLKAGLLTVILQEKVVQRLFDDIQDDPSTQVSVDLVERQVRWTGEVHGFELDDYTRWRLLEGLDDVALTLRHTGDIDEYESRRKAWLPRFLPAERQARRRRHDAPHTAARERFVCRPEILRNTAPSGCLWRSQDLRFRRGGCLGLPD